MLDFTKPIILHNNEPKRTHRKYEMVFEVETPNTVDISYKAYEAFQFKLELNFRYIENPYFETHYLFTTITPENDAIRYFFVEYSESQFTYRSYYIVQDCVNASGNSGAVIYFMATLFNLGVFSKKPGAANFDRNELVTSYTPLQDLFFEDLHVSLNSCLIMFLEEHTNQYTDFKSVFQSPHFEDEIMQYVMLGY